MGNIVSGNETGEAKELKFEILRWQYAVDGGTLLCRQGRDS